MSSRRAFRDVIMAPAIMATIYFAAAGAGAAESSPAAEGRNPQELGRVAWLRGFDDAAKDAYLNKRPLLVLFQEVPGCATCKTYGDRVLSHPLIVEAAETLFTPLAVYNNVKGDDERLLKSFHEPAWNNPVVRIMTHDRKPLAPRVNQDYTIARLATAMVEALAEFGGTPPAYLSLLAEEHSSRHSGLEKATFAMHCFWEGEGALGRIDGVVETMPGFLDGREVVEVRFDPKRVGFDQLLRQAQRMKCASRVFARTEAQAAAAKSAGADVKRSDETARPDKQPKYYLSRTPLRFVPMTALQAARINAAIGPTGDGTEAALQPARRMLSPRQWELLRLISDHPDAAWPDAIGVPIEKAWPAAQAIAHSLAGS